METCLVEILRTVSVRVYPIVAPEMTELPYITYQQVGGGTVSFLSGIADRKNARIQINVVARTYREAVTAIRELEDVLVMQMNAEAIGAAVTQHIPAIEPLYEARQDFSIWE